MSWSQGCEVKIKNTCLVDGESFVYDACSENKNAYDDWKRKKEYIGYGTIETINGDFQKTETKYHFWRWRL